MATRLGPVEIPISLDISQAERKIDSLEVKIGKAGAAGGPGPSGVPRNPDSQRAEDKKRDRLLQQLRRYYEMSSVEKWQFRMGEKSAHEAMMSRINPASGSLVQPWRDALNSGGMGAVFAKAWSLAKAPAVAAISYGIASQTSKLLPEAYALGQRLAGDSLNGNIPGVPGELGTEIPRMIEHLRQQFTNLEAKVTGIFTALQKTVNLNEASMRLTGQMPNSEYYYKMFNAIDVRDKRVQAKFDMWKKREAPAATAQTMSDLFHRSLFR